MLLTILGSILTTISHFDTPRFALWKPYEEACTHSLFCRVLSFPCYT